MFRSHKKVCIIDIDKFGDEEITGMADLISKNKIKKNYDVYETICRGDDIYNPGNILKSIPNDVTQLVIAAHSRFYKRDGETVAPLGDSDLEKDARHMGQYSLNDITKLLTSILKLRTKITEIKFYSCESAVNQETYNLPDYKKPNNTRVRECRIGKRTFEKYKHYFNNTKFEDLSNIQIIMLGIYSSLHPEKTREFCFQGINGMGYMDAKTTQKMKSFDQKHLEHSQENDFETKYVDKKKSVDKIAYFFNIPGANSVAHNPPKHEYTKKNKI